jgi:hypothetical protein
MRRYARASRCARWCSTSVKTSVNGRHSKRGTRVAKVTKRNMPATNTSRCCRATRPYDVFGPYDRKSRRAQLSIRHGDRNYDRSVAGLGTGKAKRYFASDFDRLSCRLFDANGIAAESRRWRLEPRYCTRSVSTAMQYWIEKDLTKANYMKVARIISTS